MFGFSALMAHLHWRYIQLRYLLSSRTVSKSIADVTATFDINSFQEYLRVFDYQNESYVIGQLLNSANHEDVFWDIGANIGTHSSYVGQQVRYVIAIEPHPGNAQRARENLKRNHVDGVVLEYALGEQYEEMTLGVPTGTNSTPGVGTFTLRQTDEITSIIDVDMIPGDVLLDEEDLAPPDIVKIDVEGAELQVLRGFRQGLSNAHTAVVEVHPEAVDVDNVTEFLVNQGFSVSVLRRRNEEIQLLAES